MGNNCFTPLRSHSLHTSSRFYWRTNKRRQACVAGLSANVSVVWLVVCPFSPSLLSLSLFRFLINCVRFSSADPPLSPPCIVPNGKRWVVLVIMLKDISWRYIYHAKVCFLIFLLDYMFCFVRINSIYWSLYISVKQMRWEVVSGLTVLFQGWSWQYYLYIWFGSRMNLEKLNFEYYRYDMFE